MVTTDGQTVDTGLQSNDLHPKQAAGGNMGMAAVAPDADNDAAYIPPTAGVVGSMLTLGKTVDSADDVARLMIITQYVGSNTVKVYASDVDNATNTQDDGTRAGYISIDDGDATTGVVTDGDDGADDTNNVRLRSAGTYYFAQDAG